jgi:hypothetical protein
MDAHESGENELLRCPTCRVPLPKFMAPQDSMQLDDQAGTGSKSTVVVTGTIEEKGRGGRDNTLCVLYVVW